MTSSDRQVVRALLVVALVLFLAVGVLGVITGLGTHDYGLIAETILPAAAFGAFFLSFLQLERHRKRAVVIAVLGMALVVGWGIIATVQFVSFLRMPGR